MPIIVERLGRRTWTLTETLWYSPRRRRLYVMVTGRLANAWMFSAIINKGPVIKIKQVCRSSLLLGRNVRWPRRMLPPGESRWVCRSAMGQTYRRTPNRYITLPLDAVSVWCLFKHWIHGRRNSILENVNYVAFAICYRNSVGRLSSVCLSSVTLVRPSQPVEIFGNFFTIR